MNLVKSSSIFFLLFILGTLTANLAWAEEVDDFTDPSPLPADSSAGINHLINAHLQETATKFSKGSVNCERTALEEALVYALDQNFSPVGVVLKKLAANPNGGNSGIEFFGPADKEQTIYKDTGVRGCCVRRVNVNGTLIGTDKFDHIFGNAGLLWLKQERSKRDSTKKPITDGELLRMSVNTEHGVWGLSATGVKSYGDLSANYQGLRFWRSLIDGPNPYFTCANGKLQQARQFDIKDYVDDTLDEGLNCSSYASQDIKDHVNMALSARHLSCPKSPDRCAKMVAKYHAVSDDLVHANISPLCQNPKAGFSQLEEPSSTPFDDLKSALGGATLHQIFNFVFDRGVQ